ncbi:MAG: ABC transporter permease, partial [Candidatus Obscuribacterales bacterium]|nr:ABC transporter permease [Candidatus Obscuribacterales bacterium]
MPVDISEVIDSPNSGMVSDQSGENIRVDLAGLSEDSHRRLEKQFNRRNSIERTSQYEFDSAVRPSFLAYLRQSFLDLLNYHWGVQSFVANNLTRRYRRSRLGFLWGLLGPLATLTVMSIAFALVFHQDPVRTVSYIFSGLLAWSFLSETALQGSNCLVVAEPFLKKLAIPKIFFPVVSVGTDLVNFLLSMTALLGLSLIVGVKLKLSILALPAVIAIVAVYNLGMVLIYSVATVFFRDLPHILTITYPAFFYSVPIFYPLTAIPIQYHWVFYCNPFFWF